MKIKARVIIPDKLGYQIRSEINKVIQDQGFMNEIGQEIVDDIKLNTRRGMGIKNNKSYPLAPLETSTIKTRDYLRRGGNARARPYADEFSNLSVSGQLIEALKYSIGKSGELIVEVANTLRKPYKTLKGRDIKSEPITNAELSKIHHAGVPTNNLPARPFIGLRYEMFDRIVIKLRERLRRGLKLK
jgi:phage gpG-like protein